MKKMIAILLIAVMVCCLLSVMAFADGDVLSPEYDNSNVTPTDPTSPQTGYGFGITAVIVAALVFGSCACLSIKKLVG